MRQYFFYVQDSRYSVPTFVVVDARDDEHALALARDYLLRSPNYLSIEVLEGERDVGQAAR